MLLDLTIIKHTLNMQLSLPIISSYFQSYKYLFHLHSNKADDKHKNMFKKKIRRENGKQIHQSLLIYITILNNILYSITRLLGCDFPFSI